MNCYVRLSFLGQPVRSSFRLPSFALGELPGDHIQVETRPLPALVILPAVLPQRAFDKDLLTAPGQAGEVLGGGAPDLEVDKGRDLLTLLVLVVVKLVPGEGRVDHLGLPGVNQLGIGSQVSGEEDSIDVHMLCFVFFLLGFDGLCVTGLFCVLVSQLAYQKALRGDHPRLAEREVARAAISRLADGDVIQQRDLKEFCRIGQAPGKPHIGLAGPRVARGMVMNHDQRMRRMCDRRLKHFPRVGQRFAQDTDRNRLDPDQPVLGV